jgi:hypothetical protein
VPPAILAVSALSLISQTPSLWLTWIAGIGFWGLIFGGVPYIFLSIWTVIQSRKHSTRWLKGILVLAPLLLLPLIIIWIFLILFIFSIASSGEFSIRDYLGSSMTLSIVTSIYAILTGYFFVTLTFVTCSILQRYGFVEREPSPEIP